MSTARLPLLLLGGATLVGVLTGGVPGEAAAEPVGAAPDEVSDTEGSADGSLELGPSGEAGALGALADRSGCPADAELVAGSLGAELVASQIPSPITPSASNVALAMIAIRSGRAAGAGRSTPARDRACMPG